MVYFGFLQIAFSIIAVLRSDVKPFSKKFFLGAAEKAAFFVFLSKGACIFHHSWYDSEYRNKKETPQEERAMHAALVVMAAGMGSRYGGNKQVDGVGPHGEILMEYGVYDAVRAGFDKIVFIIKPDMLELMKRLCGDMASRLRTADGRAVEVCYAYQTAETLPDFYTWPEGRTKPLGTTHAVLCTRELIREPFCVINADDYYGADAYRTIYQALQTLPERGAATMVGYLLRNTVTAHGTVSRGVCRVKDGRLLDIHETLKIALLPDGTIRDEAAGVTLDGDSVVSMNFWGFMPSVFDELEAYFYDFLRSPEAQTAKAECLLPNMVGQRLREGKLTVSVLKSEDRWFGMTYQEDRARVAQELIKLHEAGVYPAELR